MGNLIMTLSIASTQKKSGNTVRHVIKSGNTFRIVNNGTSIVFYNDDGPVGKITDKFFGSIKTNTGSPISITGLLLTDLDGEKMERLNASYFKGGSIIFQYVDGVLNIDDISGDIIDISIV